MNLSKIYTEEQYELVCNYIEEGIAMAARNTTVKDAARKKFQVAIDGINKLRDKVDTDLDAVRTSFANLTPAEKTAKAPEARARIKQLKLRKIAYDAKIDAFLAAKKQTMKKFEKEADIEHSRRTSGTKGAAIKADLSRLNKSGGKKVGGFIKHLVKKGLGIR